LLVKAGVELLALSLKSKGEHAQLRGAPALFYVLVASLLLSLYVGGYVWLSDYHPPQSLRI
jgi:hypothetical protein